MSLLKFLISACIALMGIYVAIFINLSLPWLLGSLLAIAICKIIGLKLKSFNILRNIGQWILGLTLGLYFSPIVFNELINLFIPILLSCLLAIVLGLMGTYLLKYFFNVDSSTAFFSSCIGGASEMANLAEIYGSKVDQVAAAHTLRVLIVVSVIPFIYKLYGVSGIDNRLLVNIDFNFFGFLFLAFISGALTLFFKKKKFPNPWVLIPLFVSMLLSINEIYLSRMPEGSSNIAQFLIGWSLGDKFKPDFFKRAPKFLSGILIFTVMSLVISFGFSYILISYYPNLSLPFETLILATTPGGIAEMSITAKVLQLGVPIVTAFHVFRLAFVVLLSGPLYKFLTKHSYL